MPAASSPLCRTTGATRLDATTGLLARRATSSTTRRTNHLASFILGTSPKVFAQLQIHHTQVSHRHPHTPNWLLGAQTSPRPRVLPADVWGTVQVHLTRLRRCTRHRRLTGARAIKRVPPGESLPPVLPRHVTSYFVVVCDHMTTDCRKKSRHKGGGRNPSLTHVLF